MLYFNRKVKEFPECRQKYTKQKIAVYFALYMIWKLVDQIFILLCTHGLISIILPSVIKELFYDILILDGHFPAIIKSFDESQPFGQIVAIIEVGIEACY